MLIAMTGKKRSGKDSIASALNIEFGCELVTFAGALKEMLRVLLLSAGMSADDAEECINGSRKEEPLDVLQGKTTRHAMQTLGTEWRNMIGKDLWTDIAKAKAESLNRAVITDMRFLHEETYVDNRGGLKVRTVRPGTSTGDTHPSEVEMDRIDEDITVYNHGDLVSLGKAAMLIGAMAIAPEGDHLMFARRV